MPLNSILIYLQFVLEIIPKDGSLPIIESFRINSPIQPFEKYTFKNYKFPFEEIIPIKLKDVFDFLFPPKQFDIIIRIFINKTEIQTINAQI